VVTKNQHAEDIKAAIRKTGITLEGLGRKTGVKGDTVRKSLYVPCPKGNRVIAAYLKQPVHWLWPEWYDRDGNRIPLNRAKPSSRTPARHGQKRAAA